eukprot:gene44729-55659_t
MCQCRASEISFVRSRRERAPNAIIACLSCYYLERMLESVRGNGLKDYTLNIMVMDY